MSHPASAEPLLPSPAETRPALAQALSFDDVYDQHFDFVWRTMRHLGVPPDYLDDCVQEVFLVVYRRLGEFEGRAHITTWLFSIVRNVARYHLRAITRRSSRFQTIGQSELDTVPAPPGSPHVSTESQQAAELVTELLKGVEEKKREVFILVEFERMNVAEAAQVLGLNVNTAASRLRSARKQLRQAIARLKMQGNW